MVGPHSAYNSKQQVVNKQKRWENKGKHLK